MSLLSCLRCATKFAVGLLHCPHCLSEDFEEDGVGKITVAGGASLPHKGAPVPAEPEAVAPAAEVVTEPPAPEPEPFVLKTDLQDQARELGLPVSGTKAELATAIAAAPEPEPEPAPKAAPSLSGPAKSA